MKFFFVLLAIISCHFSYCQVTIDSLTDTIGFKKIIVDQSVAKKLIKPRKESEFKSHLRDEGYWIFFDDADVKEYIGNKNIKLFLDTISEMIDLGCDCMIKKDTIYLQGGIGYEGGIGIDLKIIHGLFDAKVLLGGKGFKTNSSSEYTKEIFLNSLYQQLKIQDANSLKPGKTMIGQLILETEKYYQKDEPGPKKMYMKILFNCKLDDFIVF